MLFNTLQYALFLPVVVAIYYLAPRFLRVWILLIASYYFYASWDVTFLPLIIGLTIANYLLGLGLGRLGKSRAGNWLLAGAVIFNVAVLSLFKYAHFALVNLYNALGQADSAVPGYFSWVLPLGISFFVFEFIHYQVDIWRGNPPMKSLVNFAVFAAFFPTQIAGPIKRFEDFGPQLANPAPYQWSRTWEGLRLIVLGLFKKMILADNLAPLVVLGFRQLEPGHMPLSTADAWLVMIAFGSQLYFDFSGYTDIGRGSALLLGFKVPQNFIRPAMATNIFRFWGRWHLSLTKWLTDYVYTPLGGKKHRYRNIIITMMVGGLWHGANWTFLVWGTIHGSALAGYQFLKIKQWMPHFTRRGPKLAWTLFSWCLMAVFGYITSVFFRSPDISHAFAMLGNMFGLQSSQNDVLLNSERNLIFLIVGGRIAVELFFEHQRWLKKHVPGALVRLQSKLGFQWGEAQPVGYAVLIAAIILFRPVEMPRFFYFQF